MEASSSNNLVQRQEQEHNAIVSALKHVISGGTDHGSTSGPIEYHDQQNIPTLLLLLLLMVMRVRGATSFTFSDSETCLVCKLSTSQCLGCVYFSDGANDGGGGGGGGGGNEDTREKKGKREEEEEQVPGSEATTVGEMGGGDKGPGARDSFVAGHV
ncbi:hypothetical protein OIU84_029921 [Salix udensis]|uniref:Uncharacterized protein n=1 Tax=Salix udensis TaxID=889485 RepID=A0AAD6P7U5_9ROSI|nr:hypothetical protein OIU84_029921 [Salix udensis]